MWLVYLHVLMGDLASKVPISLITLPIIVLLTS
jgi:hypothetical protein